MAKRDLFLTTVIYQVRWFFQRLPKRVIFARIFFGLNAQLTTPSYSSCLSEPVIEIAIATAAECEVESRIPFLPNTCLLSH